LKPDGNASALPADGLGDKAALADADEGAPMLPLTREANPTVPDAPANLESPAVASQIAAPL